MTTKLKEPLFYAIHKSYFAWRVVAVTTHKPSGRWHGRYVADNETTHGTGSDLIGKFDTAEAALERVEAVQAVRSKYEPLRRAAEDEVSRLFRLEQAEMAAAVKGERDGQASTPIA
jgi:hypothetical protein